MPRNDSESGNRMAPPAPDPEHLNVRGLTWSALLGRWVDFARSALALPDDEAGQRLRESVPDIVVLQAVWFALGELDTLERGERALGLDRAGVLIERHERVLRERWQPHLPPTQLVDLIEDAHAQWKARAAEYKDAAGEPSGSRISQPRP